MGQGGQGGGMMSRGGMMGQDSAGQDKSGCPMMGDMGFRRGMRQGMGHGAMMHSVPMMEVGWLTSKPILRSPMPSWRLGTLMPTRSGPGTARWKACTPI